MVVVRTFELAVVLKRTFQAVADWWLRGHIVLLLRVHAMRYVYLMVCHD